MATTDERLLLPLHGGHLVSELFDAFAWRAPPWRDGRRACWRSDGREPSLDHCGVGGPRVCRLVDVPSRELTLDFVEAHFLDPVSCFKKEAFLYFFPAFMSFWIEEPTNDNVLIHFFTWKFRYFPFHDHAVDKWRNEILNRADSDEDKRYKDDRFSVWFLTGDKWHCAADLVLSMTSAEREAAASSFDFLRRAAPLYFDCMELESVSALFRGRPAAEVLGSCREEDNAHLLDALDTLRTRVPAVADDLAAVERAIREGTSIDVLAESVRHREAALEWRTAP